MWSAGSECWKLYLGQSAAGLAGPQGQRHWSDVASARDGLNRLQEWLAEAGAGAPYLRHRRITVCLSGALARPFLIAPLPGLRRWSELVQVAVRLAPDATGLVGPCTVWLDGWGGDQTCVAVAAERTLIDDIAASSRKARAKLVSIEPWWALALNEAMARPVRPRLLLAEDSDAVTLIGGESGRFISATTYTPRPSAVQAEALIARAIMSAGIDTKGVLRATLQSTSPRAARNMQAGSRSGFGLRLETPA